MLSLIKSLKLLLGLDKLTRPKRLVLLCVTGHVQTPNYKKFHIYKIRIQRAFVSDQELWEQHIFLEQLMGLQYNQQTER